MSSEKPVSDWVRALRDGEAEIDWKLYNHFFAKLVALARKKLQGRRPFGLSGEDMALSAFDSFFRRARNDQFELENLNDVWQLLVVITVRKVWAHLRKKDLTPAGPVELNFAQFVGREPTPEMALQAADEVRHWLESLKDDKLVTVALLKGEGYTTEEIAAKLGCSIRTVERQLRLIRQIWEEMGERNE